MAGPAILSRTGLTAEGVEVTVADIDRILHEVASAGDRFNAVTEMLPELARERAGEAAQRADEDLPPRALEGQPFAVKDIVFIAGTPTSMGSRVDVLSHPDATTGTADVIERLMAAGAIPVTKTNCQEFSHGIFGEHSAFGTVVNPAGAQLCTGGSSSGSAALVAAGAVPFAVGSDTAGSVRVPAGCQGVVGFKPTLGAVNTDGVFPLSPSFDTLGFFTRTVSEAVRVFSAVVDFSAGAPASVTVGTFELSTPHWIEDGADYLDTTTPVDLEPFIEESGALYDTVRKYESYRILGPLAEDQSEAFTPGVLDRVKQAADVPEADYQQALADVEALRERALAQFADVDVIVSPALDGGTVPWDSIGPDARPAFVRYSQLFNVLGWPAITIPTGRNYANGAPACLHIAGKPGEDATVLAVAAEVERRLQAEAKAEQQTDPQAGAN